VSRAKFGVDGWTVWMERPAQEDFIEGFRQGKLGGNRLRPYKRQDGCSRTWYRGL